MCGASHTNIFTRRAENHSLIEITFHSRRLIGASIQLEQHFFRPNILFQWSRKILYCKNRIIFHKRSLLKSMSSVVAIRARSKMKHFVTTTRNKKNHRHQQSNNAVPRRKKTFASIAAPNHAIIASANDIQTQNDKLPGDASNSNINNTSNWILLLIFLIRPQGQYWVCSYWRFWHATSIRTHFMHWSTISTQTVCRVHRLSTDRFGIAAVCRRRRVVSTLIPSTTRMTATRRKSIITMTNSSRIICK